jgi:hypothetical protein
MLADHIHDCFELPQKCCANIKRKSTGFAMFGVNGVQSGKGIKDLNDSPQN